jgi:hypothetical protein
MLAEAQGHASRMPAWRERSQSLRTSSCRHLAPGTSITGLDALDAAGPGCTKRNPPPPRRRRGRRAKHRGCLLGTRQHSPLEGSRCQAISRSAVDAAGADALERKDGRTEVVALATE